MKPPVDPEQWTRKDFGSERKLFLKAIEKNTTPYELRCRRQRLWGIAAITGLFLGGGAVGFESNIYQNQIEASDGRVSVRYIAPGQHEALTDTAIVLINGADTTSGRPLRGNTGRAVQEGLEDGDAEIWSLQDGHAAINAAEDASQIEVLADHRPNITDIIIDGYSMGGTMGYRIASDIEQDSNLQVAAVVGFSSPDGLDSLQPGPRHYLEQYIDLAKQYPGIQDSSYVRDIAEVAGQAGSYTNLQGFSPLHPVRDIGIVAGDVDHFFGAFTGVQSSVQQGVLPSPVTVYDQLKMIDNANVNQDMATLAATSVGKLQPVVVYVGDTREPGDRLVNNRKAARKLCAAAAAHHLSCFAINTPGTIHGDPEKSAKEYKQALARAVRLHRQMARNAFSYQQQVWQSARNSVNNQWYHQPIAPTPPLRYTKIQ